MKMNTQPIQNLEVSLEELVSAFKGLPAQPEGNEHYTVKFSVPNDYGNASERQLLFKWNQEKNDWELNTKGHDLLITASSR
ncbi:MULTISPECIES: hypothetical protein [Spirosoma]|uniref:Uncharacterized protein n=1 Tax=Spirosoma liriopis TaxID=2937440 RepID=A0ABT0HGZ8_9BACT|nr:MULTISPECIES: hypothetical protein [Spirosoma]MCK8491426.1 hypothetical protein [Spirosoma liriopis]UHG90794.1 hypothetical protein LQ777_21435 [Spirosoma oryzicola]